MSCPLRESAFPMLMVMVYLLLQDWTTEASGRRPVFRRLDRIHGFLEMPLALMCSPGCGRQNSAPAPFPLVPMP